MAAWKYKSSFLVLKNISQVSARNFIAIIQQVIISSYFCQLQYGWNYFDHTLIPTILFVILFLLQGDYEMVISDYGRAKSLFAGTDIRIFKRGVLSYYSYLTEFSFPLWKIRPELTAQPYKSSEGNTHTLSPFT